MNFQQFFHCRSSSAASTSTMMSSTKNDRSPHRRGVKKWSLTVFTFFLCFMACVTFMAEPVSSAVMTLNNSAEICGQTLDNADGYDFAPSFTGDIECDGSGPTLDDNAVFNCAGKSIKYIGSDPSGNNGLVLKTGSTAENCIVSGFQHGIVVSDSATKVTVTGCESRNNVYYGGFVTGGSSMTGDVDFTSCIFENNNQGLVLDRNIDSAVTIKDCEVRGNFYHGILIRSKKAVTIVGGVIENHKRHGILATRYGATGKLTIMDMEVLNNGKYAVAITGSQNPVPEITGVVMKASMTGGTLYTRGVTPTVTCSDLFGTMTGPINAGDGVCAEEGSCGDRSSMCTSLVIEGVFLSPSQFCGQTLTGGPKRYELDPDQAYNCIGSSGVKLDGSNLVLDCNNAAITGDDTSGAGTRGISIVGGIASIINCEVSGFSSGVDGDGSVMVTVTNSKMNNNLWRGFYVATGDVKVTDSEANDNGGAGFLLYLTTSGSSRLERVIVNNNSGDGIATQYFSPSTGDLYVKDSVVTNNSGTGIAMYSRVNYFEIEGCKIFENNNAIHIQSGITGGKINNSFMAGSSRGINVFYFEAGAISVSCSEDTNNDYYGFFALSVGAELEFTHSMFHVHVLENMVGYSAAFSLDNVYACGSRDNTDILTTPTAPDGSNAVCDDGAADGACGTLCSAVTAQSFAADLVSSGACPDFGWWNAE